MRHTLLGTVLALFLAPGLWALDDKDKPPGEQFKALMEEQSRLQKSLPEILKGFKDNEERQQAIKGYREKMDAFPARFLELAKKHPKDPVAVDALIKVAQSRQPPLAAEALGTLKKEHLLSERIGGLCETMAFSADAESEAFLREVLAKNAHAEPQAHAAYALAAMLKNRTMRRGADPADVAKFNAEAENLFDKVAAKHAGVKSARGETLGDLAKRELFELRHLLVGKVVPDIEGEDLDGKKFKLSDYRGKVVFLDFWGHW